MQGFEIIVDFNGIVLAAPLLLDEFYGGIMPGDNLYQRFIKTEDGDEVVNRGIVVPIIGINDGTYRIVLREQGEKSLIPENHVVVSNGEPGASSTARRPYGETTQRHAMPSGALNGG